MEKSNISYHKRNEGKNVTKEDPSTTKYQTLKKQTIPTLSFPNHSNRKKGTKFFLQK